MARDCVQLSPAVSASGFRAAGASCAELENNHSWLFLLLVNVAITTILTPSHHQSHHQSHHRHRHRHLSHCQRSTHYSLHQFVVQLAVLNFIEIFHGTRPQYTPQCAQMIRSEGLYLYPCFANFHKVVCRLSQLWRVLTSNIKSKLNQRGVGYPNV